MKKILILFIFIILIPVFSIADTIFFKSGMRMDVKKVWEEDGQIKFEMYGSVVSYPKEDIEKIEKNKIIDDVNLHDEKEINFKEELSQDSLNSPAGPEIQLRFCLMINKYRKAYQKEKNEGNPLGKKDRLNNLFEKRNVELKKLLLSGAIEGWTGNIKKLYDSSKGAFLVIELPCKTLFKATPDKLIISSDTQVYKALSQTKPKEKIKFSGILFPLGKFPGGYPELNKVVYHEDSFTQSGSMDEPEFLFRFDKIW